MKRIKLIENRYCIIAMYELPIEHSVEGIVRWVMSLKNKVEEYDDWIFLEDNHNSNDDGKDSIALSMDSDIDAIVSEINNRSIDTVVTNLKVRDSDITININVRSFVASVGYDKKDRDYISLIENTLSC